MNGGSLILVIRSPFIIPAAVPPIRPTMIAIGVGRPRFTPRLPIITDIRTMIAATLRSMPAVMMIRLCAAARMPMIDTCCMIKLRLKGEKNLPPAIKPKAARLSTSTMTGTKVGLLCKTCCMRCSTV